MWLGVRLGMRPGRCVRQVEEQGQGQPLVSAILPARNEAGRVGSTVRAVMAAGLADEVLVVDDASRDGTGREAALAGARVIALPRHGGKGRALRAGVLAAAGGVLLFLDADLEDTAREAGRLLAPVLAGTADMAVAVLPRPPVRGGLGLALGAARWGVMGLTGRRLEAPLSGQRALRRAVWEALAGCPGGFGVEVALTVDALRAGYRLAEVPVPFRHRATGRDLAGFLHRGRQMGAIGAALAPRVMAPHPWRGAPRHGA